MKKEEYKLSIVKYPSGKYGFVGNIPEELCELRKNNIGQEFLASKVFNNKKEITKLLKNYEK